MRARTSAKHDPPEARGYRARAVPGESAGISILEGETFFRWHAVAGPWAHFVNGGMPRSASPCGTVIDRDAPLLFSQPGRYFPEMAKVDPLAAYALLVPFHVRGQPVGTVWVVAHDRDHRFDQEDLRVLTSLSRFAAAAYQAHVNVALGRKLEERTAQLSIRNESLVSVAQERDRLIGDLELNKVELETQNRQLREAQHLLEESRARYSDLYDFAPVTYCTLTLSGCIAEINLAGAELLETSRANLIGTPFELYLSTTGHVAFRAYLEQRRGVGQEHLAVELVLASTSSSSKVIQMVSTYVHDRDGAIVGYRAALTDITELKRAETALRLAVRMREDFLAVVSHDLRNPLTSISLAAQILVDPHNRGFDALAVIERIDRAATRMARMLSDLLDLSSMDAGHLSMEPKVERVGPLLMAIVESCRASAAQKSIRLEVALEAPNLVAYCDRDRVSQVVVNLVVNAIKFSHQGDLVTIEARQYLDCVEIAVRDSGVGLDASQLEHIFDPYWQVAATAKKGTGLGLSIAKGIVEMHGGRFRVESTQGRGSSFIFTLPTAPVSTETERARRPSSPGPLPRTRSAELAAVVAPMQHSVLVVDD